MHSLCTNIFPEHYDFYLFSFGTVSVWELCIRGELPRKWLLLFLYTRPCYVMTYSSADAVFQGS